MSDRGWIVHRIKILPKYFEAVNDREKNFELRKDDRDYRVGDFLTFLEWDGTEYTGRRIGGIQIQYILRNCPEYGLMDGYCILGF